jgi:hypothetical protein
VVAVVAIAGIVANAMAAIAADVKVSLENVNRMV